MKKRAVYAGTFDLLTNGHLWMIEQGAKLFDELVVAIGINPDKDHRMMFNIDERLSILIESISSIGNIVVRTFPYQYLVNYAQEVGASYILRGIRNNADYAYEHAMRNINGDLNSEIQTIFLMPPRHLVEVSSSMVKGLVGPKGWEDVVRNYVPEPVFKRLEEKHSAKS